MADSEFSSYRTTKIVIIVLVSGAVFVASGIATYFLIAMYRLAGDVGQPPAWFFFLTFVFSPLSGAILIILGIWLKVVTRDSLGWYGAIMGVGIAMIVGYLGAVLPWAYFQNHYVVHLNVLLDCIGSSAQSTSCYENSGGITPTDADVAQSPKLKEALVGVLAAKPDGSNGKWSKVDMNMEEFDSMNAMIVNTKQDAVYQNGHRTESPTLTLFPKANSIVFANYAGNSYQLIPTYQYGNPPGQWLG